MEFFKCSIGGVAYGTGLTEIAITKAKREERALPPIDNTPLPGVDVKFLLFIYLQKFWVVFADCTVSA